MEQIKATLNEAGAVVETAVPAKNARISFFEDDEAADGAALYSGSVLIGDGDDLKAVRVRELTGAEYGRVVGEQKTIAEAKKAHAKSVAALEEKARRGANEAEVSDEAEAINREFDAINARELGLWTWVCEKTVAGWDLGVPYSPERLGKLRPAFRAQIFAFVLERSSIDKPLHDFLAPSSPPTPMGEA